MEHALKQEQSEIGIVVMFIRKMKENSDRILAAGEEHLRKAGAPETLELASGISEAIRKDCRAKDRHIETGDILLISVLADRLSILYQEGKVSAKQRIDAVLSMISLPSQPGSLIEARLEADLRICIQREIAPQVRSERIRKEAVENEMRQSRFEKDLLRPETLEAAYASGWKRHHESGLQVIMVLEPNSGNRHLVFAKLFKTFTRKKTADEIQAEAERKKSSKELKRQRDASIRMSMRGRSLIPEGTNGRICRINKKR